MDPILIWNLVALEANRVSHSDGSKEQNGPTLSSRALAIVHLAMYDAFAAIRQNPTDLPPYLDSLPPNVPPDTEENLKDAVAGAAFEALTCLFPSQKKYFENQLEMFGNSDSDAHQFGSDVATILLNLRDNDPSASRGKYFPPSTKGTHQIDPDNPGQGFHAPFYGAKMKPFATTAHHGLDKINLTDQKYLNALRQVRAKGIKPELMGTLGDEFEDQMRSPEETMVGIYWGYDGAIGLGTPPRFFNQIVRQIAVEKGNTPDQNARLFALVNAAMGDAGIYAWYEKYDKNIWRPVVGIREHDDSIGAGSAGAEGINGDADPGWLPLGAPSSNTSNPATLSSIGGFPFANIQFSTVKNFTPNFPAYPSGHATFGAAALHITRLFYDDKYLGKWKADDLLKDAGGEDISFVSDEFNGNTQDNNGTIRPLHRRTFEDGLWGMIIENGLSRVFLGVHWSFDAFAVKGSAKNPKPDVKKQTEMIGGVPLGLRIAEDIFSVNKKAPKISALLPRNPDIDKKKH